MKRIQFGFANESNPSGSWGGIGISEGLFLTEADYYGSISVEGNSYIIAKVTEDEYGRYPQLLDKFIVRQALYDMFADGSGVLYLNQGENEVTQKLAEQLNRPEVSEKIQSPEDFVKLGMPKGPRSFTLVELNDNIIATSIRPDVFERKNSAIKNCHQPISVLQESLSQEHSMTM